MSDSQFEHFEGDWDEFFNEFNWSESQWRDYLKGSDRDTARFLAIYNSVKDDPNHLDVVASMMGWDAEDISMTEEFSVSEVEEKSSQEDESAPYTLHRHPRFCRHPLTLPLFAPELGTFYAAKWPGRFRKTRLGLRG